MEGRNKQGRLKQSELKVDFYTPFKNNSCTTQMSGRPNARCYKYLRMEFNYKSSLK